MSDLALGDTVQLKSGGPRMTVSEFGDYSHFGTGPADGVKCVWFDGKRRMEEVFVRATLRKVGDDDEDAGGMRTVRIERT